MVNIPLMMPMVQCLRIEREAAFTLSRPAAVTLAELQWPFRHGPQAVGCEVDPRPHAGRHPCAETSQTDIRGVLCLDVVMFALCLATRMREPDQQEIGREG
jgi:hypothetical protein